METHDPAGLYVSDDCWNRSVTNIWKIFSQVIILQLSTLVVLECTASERVRQCTQATLDCLTIGLGLMEMKGHSEQVDTLISTCHIS